MKALTTLISDSNDLLIITPEQVDEWTSEIPNDSEITITVTGISATGVMSESQMTLIADSPIVAPKGACVTYTWKPTAACADDATTNTCSTQQVTALSPTTRLGVLDTNNCVTQYITLEQVLAYVNSNIEDPQFCELVTAEPEQPSAGMRVLGVDDSCQLVSIPVNSLDCTMTTPEPFSCE